MDRDKENKIEKIMAGEGVVESNYKNYFRRFSDGEIQLKMINNKQ